MMCHTYSLTHTPLLESLHASYTHNSRVRLDSSCCDHCVIQAPFKTMIFISRVYNSQRWSCCKSCLRFIADQIREEKEKATEVRQQEENRGLDCDTEGQ